MYTIIKAQTPTSSFETINAALTAVGAITAFSGETNIVDNSQDVNYIPLRTGDGVIIYANAHSPIKSVKFVITPASICVPFWGYSFKRKDMFNSTDDAYAFIEENLEAITTSIKAECEKHELGATTVSLRISKMYPVKIVVNANSTTV